MGAATLLPFCVVRTPKRGHTDAEYEDASAADARAGRFAVADGASESSDAGLWAKLLAEAFVAASRPWNGLDWLDRPRRRWSEAVDGQEMPWYAEMKREQGAFATLLGMAVRPPGRGKRGGWQALAVGDSCLVRVRDGEPPLTFPLTKAAEFGNHPRLLGSRPSADPASPPPVLSRGDCRPGDRFFLMTDALAQWFLVRSESQRHPWDDLALTLAQPKPDDAFTALVEKLRDRGDLRNDDVTLLAVGPIPTTAGAAKA